MRFEPTWTRAVVTSVVAVVAAGTTVLVTPASASPGRTSGRALDGSAHAAALAETQVSAVAAGTAPVIVIDPGHSPSINATDPATGLTVSDYENEPEMHDVFAVAQLVRAKLQADGYRVIFTKNHVTDRVSLAQRAAIANSAHAVLALSIHDQAGPNGGIGFRQGNNTVYYQSVGTYRANPQGRRFYFTDRSVAAASQRCGLIFAAQRKRAQGTPISLRGNVGYDLGSRGLAPGNIWMVQLLSHVPWIYNEAGGNSSGMSGLNRVDRQRYANGLVAGVEHCRPTGNPVGHLDRISPIAGGFHVRGWAADPNTTSPIPVDIYADGRGLKRTLANLPRPDIQRRWPAWGADHGFSTSVALGAGTHTICLFVINRGAGSNRLLRCVRMTIAASPPRR